MGGGGQERTKRHSQEKVLRAFLDHVTGSVPAVKPGGPPPPAGGEPGRSPLPTPSQPADSGSAAHPSSPPGSRGVATRYSVSPPEKAAVDRRPPSSPTTDRHRVVASSPPGPAARSEVGSAPTEIRPSPHAGLTPPGSVPAVRAGARGRSDAAPALSASKVSSRADASELLGGKYRLVRILGRGGVGEVWEAIHDVIGLRVAVKLIRYEYAGNPELNARFIQEARAAAAVGHPGIVQVHDVGTSPDGRAYLVLEFLEGEDFEKVLARRQQLSVGETADVLVDVLDALAAAHAKGILHRHEAGERLPGARRKGARVVVARLRHRALGGRDRDGDVADAARRGDGYALL